MPKLFACPTGQRRANISGNRFRMLLLRSRARAAAPGLPGREVPRASPGQARASSPIAASQCRNGHARARGAAQHSARHPMSDPARRLQRSARTQPSRQPNTRDRQRCPPSSLRLLFVLSPNRSAGAGDRPSRATVHKVRQRFPGLHVRPGPRGRSNLIRITDAISLCTCNITRVAGTNATDRNLTSERVSQIG